MAAEATPNPPTQDAESGGRIPRVGILMGSDSDLPILRQAFEVLNDLGIPFEATVASAHRTPDRVARYAASAADRGLEVLIAAAGSAAHLAGVVAAHTLLPVIGVPLQGGAAGGLDALLATAQMPRGVPVATVALDGAANAALLAARILALKDPGLRERLAAYRRRMQARVAEADRRLQAELAQIPAAVTPPGDPAAWQADGVPTAAPPADAAPTAAGIGTVHAAHPAGAAADRPASPGGVAGSSAAGARGPGRGAAPGAAGATGRHGEAPVASGRAGEAAVATGQEGEAPAATGRAVAP
ncbi:5-(carboxyamino)imidazole ribonucleotide mutase [Thermaerobacter composti]|uniref:N5-carboxyaminoimidazole ribonucleotide mutase n=1 Tax=Thermaerobacter composti TaxID=554949 RepID=A0ABZ0QP56_9FIRM|nr:5-(carboxyamino)imidazole ribonucleotide mutase [Thermaerobacter composti]WPD18198.1 5-(carboxyamino)imidazole ribonucleotide mutase [Thermaerobacter composti]